MVVFILDDTTYSHTAAFFCCTFEDTDLVCNEPTSKVQSRYAAHTQARSKFYKKIGYALIIRYPSSHFQASLNER